MGSHMKKAIFDEQTSRALMKWRKQAKKKKDESKRLGRKLGEGREDSLENNLPADSESPETADGENAAPYNQPGKNDLLTSP